MQKIQYLHSNSRASQVVIYGHQIETAGFVAQSTEQDIQQQTLSVLQQLEQHLHEVGADKHQIIRMQIWLADMTHFDAMNEIYDAWVSDINKPARACVGAQLASPDYLIEIQATAVLA